MTLPVPVLIVLGLIIAAHARLNAVVLGMHFSVPVLGLIFAVLILILVIAVLLLARSLAREIRRPRHRWAYS
jgi:uncharacterized membrane protein